MVGVLNDKEIDALLKEQRFGRLGCHAKGKTYVVPVSYAFDGKRLVGQTSPGLKIDMMRANPDVCLEVDDIRSLTEWRSAIVWGKYYELSGIEAAEAMGMLIDRYGPVFEEVYSGNRLGRNVVPARPNHTPTTEIVYAIDVLEKSGRFERSDA